METYVYKAEQHNKAEAGGGNGACYDPAREARTKSARYFLNALLSRSRSFVANSCAASGGQFCAGRKTVVKNSYASGPRAFDTAWRKLQISCNTYRHQIRH